jgi:DNA polymerase III delta prime subunit
MRYANRLRELAKCFGVESKPRLDLVDAADEMDRLVGLAGCAPTINVTMECPVKQIECSQRIGAEDDEMKASVLLGMSRSRVEDLQAALKLVRSERDAAKADAESRKRVGDAIRDSLGLSDGDHVLQAIDELRGDLEEQRSLKETALADLKRVRGERDHLAKREMEGALLCREAGDRCEGMQTQRDAAWKLRDATIKERDRYQERVKQLEQRLHVMRKISDGRLVVRTEPPGCSGE